MFTINNETQSGSTITPRLEGNKIHTVTFEGAEAVTIGKDTTYDVIKISFKNDNGSFEDSIFPPKMPEGAARTANSFGGMNASAVEELSAKLRHYIAALNPELDKQIEAGTKTLSAKTWNDLRTLFVKSVEKGKGKTVQLKLLKKGDGNVTTPGYILSISKTGSLYMNTNFIGETIAFTDKELKKIETAAKAKPTNIADAILGDKSNKEAVAEDLDFALEDLD
jgi:hypothetical protein